jgi:hypothetical protein
MMEMDGFTIRAVIPSSCFHNKVTPSRKLASAGSRHSLHARRVTSSYVQHETIASLTLPNVIMYVNCIVTYGSTSIGLLASFVKGLIDKASKRNEEILEAF